MKPRSFIPRASAKTLAKNGGKMFSTVKRSIKPIPQVNAVAKAKRDARYRKVISSSRWKALRRKVWERMIVKRDDPGIVRRCENCGVPLYELKEMQLAHLTYARFGHELDSDVEGQCKNCNQTEAALRGKRIRRSA